MSRFVTEPAIFYTGLLLLLAAVAQAGAYALRAGAHGRMRIRRYHAEKQNFVAQVQLALRAARAADARRASWQGTRPLIVSAIVDETHDVRSFYLTDPEGRLLPQYEPGQYLTLHLPIGVEGKPIVRCYSLSDRWRGNYYRVTIKRCPPPRDGANLAAGRASNWIHDQVRVGTQLEVAAPTGAFFLDPRYREPIVLIAGGVGITPLFSMLAELAVKNDDRPVWLFYGNRTHADFTFREAVTDVMHDFANLHCRFAYSSPAAATSDPLERRGRITAEWVMSQLLPGKHRFYLCGPAGMMQSIVVGLLEQGVADDMIHFEAFGPASVKPKPSPQIASPVQVRFAKQGEACTWTGEFDNLLELAEAQGIDVEFGCRAGNCGQCAVDVVEGSVETLRRPGCQVRQGQCLLCISTPKSPVVLEV